MKRKTLYRFILVFLLLIILYFIWPDPFKFLAKRVILPASEKMRKMAQILYSPIDILAKVNNLEKENKRLTDENQLLKSQVAAVNQQQQICKELGAENIASGVINRLTVSARVIGRTPQDFNRIIVINVGEEDGVKPGAAVLSMGYLLGRISAVSAGQSEVALITDHKSLIPAVLEKSRETGLVQGGLEGLVLTEIPVNSVIEKGEKVLTSGLGGDLPAGIIIGDISESQKSSSLFQSAKINYPVQSTKIEIVSVIK